MFITQVIDGVAVEFSSRDGCIRWSSLPEAMNIWNLVDRGLVVAIDHGASTYGRIVFVLASFKSK